MKSFKNASSLTSKYCLIQLLFFSYPRCFIDDSVQLYKSDINAFRFSIQTFQFVGIKNPKFYVHCDVSICDVGDGESFCAQGCKNKVKRRRRAGSKRRRINTGKEQAVRLSYHIYPFEETYHSCPPSPRQAPCRLQSTRRCGAFTRAY